MDELVRLRSALSDRYRIDREIGHGGMATVYLADDLKHDRRVAIKVLRPDLASMLGAERFLREIHIEAGLQHINILPIHDSGESDGFLYYVMPYVEGESLRGRIDREKQLPLDDALQITHEIAEALRYAHEHGIVHRDIKPENILLSEGHAVLADFGIARAIGAAGGKRITESGHAVGTPAYMSPEQASGETDLDGRSDVYSLGCVLYEMLVGEPPFTGRTAQAVIARHMLENPPPLNIVRPAVPPRVGEAIERALAKTPADRYATASDFLATLETPAETTARRGRQERRREPALGVSWLLQEVRERLVLHVGIAYLAFAWFAIQFTGTLVEHGAVERWITPIVLIFVAVALPLVLAVAWAREPTLSSNEKTKARRFWPRWAEKTRSGALLALLAGLAVALFAGDRILADALASGERTMEGLADFDPSHVAVLYFDDHTEGEGNRHLAAAFTTTLIGQLGKVEALRVRSAGAVKPFRDTNAGTNDIAEELRVGSIVEGSILGVADLIRVTVRLVDATGTELEAQTLEYPQSEILFLMDAITEEVARFLRGRLGVEIRLRERRLGTESIAAWTLLQKAQQLKDDHRPLASAGDTAAAAAALRRADSLLAEAQTIDVNWVEPIVLRGWVARDRARLFQVTSRTFEPQWIRSGIVHAERALKLEPANAAALELRGVLRYQLWETPDSVEAAWLREGAEEDLRAAVTEDPSRARAWSGLYRILRVSGRHREAKQAAERAYEADAFLEDARIIVFYLGHISLELEEFDDVVRWCAEGRRRWPDRATFVGLQLTYLAGPDGPDPDPERAWQVAEQFVELSPPQRRAGRRATSLMRVAAVLARSGLSDSAEAVIQQARTADMQDMQHDPLLDYYEANVRLQLGERDAALRLLRLYLEARPDRKAYIREEWWWRRLREDSRFKALVGDDKQAASVG